MSNQSFPKSARLLSAYQFRRVNKFGKTVGGKHLTVQICTSKHLPRKLGLTVTRKFGNAVQRNQFKRLVREAFRLSQDTLPTHIHFNVRPTLPFVQCTLKEIQKELIKLLS